MRIMERKHCHNDTPSCHSHKKRDWLLLGSSLVITLAYISHLLKLGYAEIFSASAFDLINTMWWGILLGIFFVGLLSKIPREFITSMLGNGGGLSGILRATMAGLLLDLCSHGILLVGMKLYERGATIGQVMAFLIASPWNSISLTFILIALIGLKWTLVFIVLSMLIAVISGLIFEWLVKRKTLPENPNKIEMPEDFRFFPEAKTSWKKTKFTPALFREMAIEGASESGMILRWIFFGVVLASLLRTFVDTGTFETYFGATLAGLGMTIIAATVIEVCSEGSTPIAADILTRAKAPGNSFAFLMTGVSTDYTEIMSLKERTGSWKISLFLPLVTVPQVITIAWLINNFS